ncbi:MAG: ThuA domain-containing protein, partial [Chthoniobacteraceae bacterium]
FLTFIIAFYGMLPAAEAVAAKLHVLIVVGPSTHPPGTHEVAAGGRVLKHCLDTMANVPGVTADLFYEWPQDDAILDSAASVVFIGDQFPPMRLPNSAATMTKLDAMMKRGCGIVCVHYATGLSAADVGENGEHPLLQWMGGYFATKCKHHQSIAKIYPAATITPAVPTHQISRGWREFTLNDEPYINNYFSDHDNKLAPNVTALATSLLPPEAPKSEIVSWCIERPDTGRGFAIVMPHFFRNWKIEELRRFILNGIVWTVKVEVPPDGVQTILPDLASFQPESLEPKPREPKPAGPVVPK